LCRSVRVRRLSQSEDALAEERAPALDCGAAIAGGAEAGGGRGVEVELPLAPGLVEGRLGDDLDSRGVAVDRDQRRLALELDRADEGRGVGRVEYVAGAAVDRYRVAIAARPQRLGVVECHRHRLAGDDPLEQRTRRRAAGDRRRRAHRRQVGNRQQRPPQLLERDPDLDEGGAGAARLGRDRQRGQLHLADQALPGGAAEAVAAERRLAHRV